jgi:hypothetical protein
MKMHAPLEYVVGVAKKKYPPADKGRQGSPDTMDAVRHQ